MNTKIRSNKYTDYICSTRTGPPPTASTPPHPPSPYQPILPTLPSPNPCTVADTRQTSGAPSRISASQWQLYWTSRARTPKCRSPPPRNPSTSVHKTGRELTAAEGQNSISGKMTAALVVYSAVFMRYSMAVTPANYLLFGRPSLCPAPSAGLAVVGIWRDMLTRLQDAISSTSARSWRKATATLDSGSTSPSLAMPSPSGRRPPALHTIRQAAGHTLRGLPGMCTGELPANASQLWRPRKETGRAGRAHAFRCQIARCPRKPECHCDCYDYYCCCCCEKG